MSPLHVVLVVSNPCEYGRRWELARECERRMLATDGVVVYVVEMVYGDQAFRVTSRDEPRHLQVRTDSAPLWHKENMVNMGVQKLLPDDWSAFAWIDADVEFDSPHWPSDALEVLQKHDVAQLFSVALDMDRAGRTMNVFHGFGFQHARGHEHCSRGADLFHPGYAWAMTRRAYERLGGLSQRSILGSGDTQMALALLGSSVSIPADAHPNYRAAMRDLVSRSSGLSLGYVPGVLSHHFHGTKENRRYEDRWSILTRHGYDPDTHVYVDSCGVLAPTATCPSGLLADIMQYFRDRKEDD